MARARVWTWWRTWAVALILATLGAGEGRAESGGNIGGVVEGPAGPIPRATVELSGPTQQRTETNAEGTFVFEALPAGRYRLQIRKVGFIEASLFVDLAESEVTSVRVRLVAEPARESAAARTPSRDSAPVPAPVPAPANGSSQPLARRGDSAPPLPTEPHAPAPRTAEPTKADAPAAAPAHPSGGLGMAGTGAGGTGTGVSMGRGKVAASRGFGTMGPPPKPVVSSSDVVSSTEEYADYGAHQWTMAATDALSTFAVDVDTASYTIVRRKLLEGSLPPPQAVRVEEIINYFQYDYPAPTDGPFAVYMESAPSPFEPKLQILRVGLKGEVPAEKQNKAIHLTFLVDTSGSMNSADKIGLVKRSLRLLVDNLSIGDTVALCTYAGSVREVLPPTGMDQRSLIHGAIEDLTAGGSTAMASGLELAYRLAAQNRVSGAENRIIVCSDGDANVGRTQHGDMLASIEYYAKQGITLSTIGFGMGNYKDTKMEQLANKGDGNYYYIDGFAQARRIFGEQLLGTLQVIARDVKIQVEFDPVLVKKYRLIGYENRDIADRDFRNDAVDAGEVGAGHAVTALYEVEVTDPASNWATARVRWKRPFSDVSQGERDAERASEREFPLQEGVRHEQFASASPSFRRAVAAAAWAENLRKSPFTESWTMSAARQLAVYSLDRETAEELELVTLIDTTAALFDSTR